VETISQKGNKNMSFNSLFQLVPDGAEGNRLCQMNFAQSVYVHKKGINTYFTGNFTAHMGAVYLVQDSGNIYCIPNMKSLH
jgi:hypothetical protein